VESRRLDQTELLNFILESTDEGIVAIDPEGRILMSNPASERILGFRPFDFPVRLWGERFQFFRQDGTACPVEELPLAKGLQGQVVKEFRLRMVHPERPQGVWLSVSSRPMKDEEGRIVAAVTSFREISEQIRSELERREYRVILEGVTEAITVQDPTGRLVFANDAAARICGFDSPEELIGAPPGEVLGRFEITTESGDPYPPERLPGQRALGGEDRPSSTVRWRTRPDGPWRWSRVSAAPVRDGEGKILFAVNFWHETTTERISEQALRESEERFRATFEQAVVGFAQVGTDGRFLRVNRKLSEMLGYSEEELSSRTFGELTFPADRDRDLGVFRRMLAGEQETYTTEKRYIRRNGEVIWAHLMTRLIRDDGGAPRYFASVIQDITERKRAEQALGQRTEQLARSNEELEQYATVASHDLQEPLRAVSGYAQLLQRRYAGHLDADADRFIGYIVEGVQRMWNLINDLLAYSRAGRGESFSAVSLDLVLDRVLKNLSASIQESQTVVSREPLPVVLGDEGQMVQLLQNLVGNAIRFRRGPGPKIQVSATPSNGRWVVSVKDDGIGIDPAFFDRLFVLFQRLHSKEEYPGTGIGLAMSKKIVERHGGKIWLESDPGQGSTFYFSLPDAKGVER
jgi:PAS domain S-box-containing protein